MLKILLATTFTLAAFITTATKAFALDESNCDSFATQPEAQIFYIHHIAVCKQVKYSLKVQS